MNIATVQNFLPFSVNGSEKVRIDNAGNVGIGTSAPTVLLDVSGAVKVRGALDMTSQNITNLAAPTISTDVSTKGYVDGVSAVFANLGASATSDAGSNTRIGASALSVVTGGNNTAIGKSAGATVTSGTQNVYVGSLAAASSATATNEIAIGYNVAGLGSNTAVIGNSSISTTVLRGNVGIGTTAPGAVLDISGTVKVRGTLDLSTNNITNANQISATSTLVLQPNGGNICIGRTTSSTGSMFDLSNSVGIRTRYSTSDTSLTIGVWPTTNNGGEAFMWNETGAISFGSNNSERIRITSAGNVGIGTTNPSVRLDISGGTIKYQNYYFRFTGINSDGIGNGMWVALNADTTTPYYLAGYTQGAQSAGRYTYFDAPINGIYHLSYTFNLANTLTAGRFYIGYIKSSAANGPSGYTFSPVTWNGDANILNTIAFENADLTLINGTLEYNGKLNAGERVWIVVTINKTGAANVNLAQYSWGSFNTNVWTGYLVSAI